MLTLARTEAVHTVAREVTLVVLIILATVSINAVLGDNGIIKKAQKAKQIHENSMQTEQEMMNTLLDEYENMMEDDSFIGRYNTIPSENIIEPDNPPTPEGPKGPNGKPLVNKDTVSETNHEKIIGEDTLGNQVAVPKGFKIADESGATVKEGIIIEDNEGNQFVWIPVSNIDGNGTGKIKVNSTEEEGVEITLGRYTFATSNPGTPTLVQKGSEYAVTTLSAVVAGGSITQYRINGYRGYHYELTDTQISNEQGGYAGMNTTAKNLKGFIESVENNHGYYIARYEASYGSGYDSSSETPYVNATPLSKKSTAYGTIRMNYAIGTLWNRISQGDAATVCRNMYGGNSSVGVESDLCNSYAWDTAIVYIQAMGHSNYANADRFTTGNKSLENTGDTEDEVCHIYDIAANLFEWTTEYSVYNDSIGTKNITQRGGAYNINLFASVRESVLKNVAGVNSGFRILLY